MEVAEDAATPGVYTDVGAAEGKTTPVQTAHPRKVSVKI